MFSERFGPKPVWGSHLVDRLLALAVSSNCLPFWDTYHTILCHSRLKLHSTGRSGVVFPLWGTTYFLTGIQTEGLLMSIYETEVWGRPLRAPAVWRWARSDGQLYNFIKKKTQKKILPTSQSLVSPSWDHLTWFRFSLKPHFTNFRCSHACHLKCHESVPQWRSSGSSVIWSSLDL